MKYLLLVCLLFVAGCGADHRPPNLTPPAVIAWEGTKVIKTLDLIRDVAIDANNVVPPQVSTDTTRQVVAFHRSAITVVHDAKEGWRATVNSSLDQLVRNLVAHDKGQLAAYIELIRNVLKAVQS